MAKLTPDKLRAAAHLQAVLRAGGNATAAVRAERPYLTPGSARTMAWRRTRKMREALAEDQDFREILQMSLPDDVAYSRLAELAMQAENLTVSLGAIRHRDKLLGRDRQQPRSLSDRLMQGRISLYALGCSPKPAATQIPVSQTIDVSAHLEDPDESNEDDSGGDLS